MNSLEKALKELEYIRSRLLQDSDINLNPTINLLMAFKEEFEDEKDRFYMKGWDLGYKEGYGDASSSQ